jgi:antitoxin component YwqK of YwqJK toxin-antitoxin module
MRKLSHILSLILTVTLFVPSFAFGLTMDNLVKRDGVYYKKFSDVPFTGKVTGQRQGSLKDGKWDGPYVRYHDNGQLESKGTYKDGKEDGPYVSYYDNGQLKIKTTYKNGKRHGPWVVYYINGQFWEKGTLKDGKMDGPWVRYNENGQLEAKDTFKNGVKVSD